jgi:ribosome biogenesis GTPase
VLPVSALTGAGVDALAAQLGSGQSAVLLGSSGAGKSTLVNRLAGADVLATGAVREYDERGRHTTTHRELIELPSGALLIDTPGIKVVGVTGAQTAGAFADIEALARECRFADCTHTSEPGCAVAGAVDPARLAAWAALAREAAWEATRTDERARAARRRHGRNMSRQLRRMYRERER